MRIFKKKRNEIYKDLYDFQSKLCKALGLQANLVYGIEIHMPVADVVKIYVDMYLSRKQAKSLLKLDWAEAPKEYILHLEKLEDDLEHLDP